MKQFFRRQSERETSEALLYTPACATEFFRQNPRRDHPGDPDPLWRMPALLGRCQQRFRLVDTARLVPARHLAALNLRDFSASFTGTASASVRIPANSKHVWRACQVCIFSVILMLELWQGRPLACPAHRRGDLDK